ncbi:MAG: sodium:proton antiporter [SAR324 cluster bacterium]|nr:sodium:proton antiporter [SAR324 cluster bacterium]
MNPRRIIGVTLFLSLFVLYAAPALAAEGGSGFVPPVWTVVPFVGILLSIAVWPLFAPHAWEHHFGKISAAWIVLAIVIMAVSVDADWTFLSAYGSKFFSTYEEYFSFIVLLGSLYVISGGICIVGDIKGTPATNTSIILVGSLLASLIGTTGAAMLLIRPLLKANRDRKHQAHVVLFFIFLVCNIGGSLTPIGDPPLFLGFLQGIPFQWTLVLTPMWAFAVTIVLAIFYVLDRYLMEKDAVKGGIPAIKVEGSLNFLLLLGVVGSVIMSGVLHFETTIPVGSLGVFHIQNLLRDGIMILLAVGSLLITAKSTREKNHFNYAPILEVAYLFIGIFTTMIPVLMLLNARGAELGLETPAAYFWITGLLSSFLDNAPTYLTFLATAMGSLGLENAIEMTMTPEAEGILVGISLGAVFMGANTYIGNGPNFMVKAIAESEGVKMPSFFGYLLYSVIVLFPVFILITFIFF